MSLSERVERYKKPTGRTNTLIGFISSFFKGYEKKKAESQQWIPVSSGKLPEMNKPVLVTHNGKYQAFVSVDWIDPYTTEWNRTCNVTAWCPLPEPWKGGAEECH